MSTKQTVSEVMIAGDALPSIETGVFLREALEIMNRRRLGIVCVVGADRQLEGIITDGDVRRLLLKWQAPLAQLFVQDVASVMHRNPSVVSPGDEVGEVLRLMNSRNIWVMPVVADGRCVGIAHMQHLLHARMGDRKEA